MTTSTEREIGLGFNDVALCVDKVHGASDAKRAIGTYLNFYVLTHRSNPGNRVVLESAMGGAVWTSFWIQSGGCAHA